MLLACSSSSLAFCFHWFSSYRAVSEASVLWLRRCCCSAYAWLEIFLVVILLTPLVRPCCGGNLEVRQTQGNLTYRPGGASPRFSIHSYASREVEKQYQKGTVGSKMELRWETKTIRWNKRACSSLNQRSCNYQSLLQRSPGALKWQHRTCYLENLFPAIKQQDSL